MAIARGAGTEIIRCHHFEDIQGGSDVNIIIGEQHHIYTVLSVIVYGNTVPSNDRNINLAIRGFDSFGGTTQQFIRIFGQHCGQGATFVWNDKFSFNGFEPVDEGSGVVGQMSTAAEQNAIADQGSAVAQKLQFQGTHDNAYYDVHITYIDQNNA